MHLKDFMAMPQDEMAALVKESGPKVVVFPVNGTRRWFIIEGKQAFDADAYLNLVIEKHIEAYQVFFDHGIQTLFTPIFGDDILARGENDKSYQVLLDKRGLYQFAENHHYLNFYKSSDVKVGVYGDYKRKLKDTPYAEFITVAESLTQKTSQNKKHTLYFGVFANDATENVAEISVNFYQKHGRLPNRREIVTAYYGNYVDPVDIFIGFDRPSAYDMPLITLGHESLYFMVAPSLYMNSEILRAILFDHMFARQVDDNYTDISAESLEALKDFYRINRNHVLGLGRLSLDQRYWLPAPEVEIPKNLK